MCQQEFVNQCGLLTLEANNNKVPNMKTADLFRKTLDVFFEKKITTQSRLADELNIHRVNMNNFIKGRRGFSEDRKELIAKHLGMTYSGMLDLGRRLTGHEPFYWAVREVWLDEDRRTELLEKLGVEEAAVFNPLRKMLFKESMKTSIVEALGTTLMELVERGKEIMVTEPGLRWELNDGYKMISSSVGITWSAEPAEPESPPEESLGTRLKSSRDNLGLTQAQLAQKLGVGLSSYQCYERGERDIPASVLISLVGLGVDAAWLLTGCFTEESKKTVNGDVDMASLSHNALVDYFKQKELAREINWNLIKLEAVAPESLREINAFINMKLNLLGVETIQNKPTEETIEKKKTGNG